MPVRSLIVLGPLQGRKVTSFTRRMTSCRRPTTLLASGAGPPRHRRALEFSWQRPGSVTSASTLEMMKCKKDKKGEDAKMILHDTFI